MLHASNLAADFKRFETTVDIAVRRIEFVLDTQSADAPDMKSLIIRHVDLAAIANDCISKNEEDFYNLAIYLVASHFRQTELAIETLELELQHASYPPLKRWLRFRVTALKSGKNSMADFSTELTSLTKTLNIRE